MSYISEVLLHFFKLSIRSYFLRKICRRERFRLTLASYGYITVGGMPSGEYFKGVGPELSFTYKEKRQKRTLSPHPDHASVQVLYFVPRMLTTGISEPTKLTDYSNFEIM